VAVLFPARQFPTLLGISLGVGLAGGLAATAPFERAVHAWGWRPSLLGVGLLCAMALPAAAILARAAREKDARRAPGAAGPALRAILRNRGIIPVLVVASVNFSTYFLFQAILGKKLLLDYYGMPSAPAAGFIFIMMAVTIGCVLLGGPLSRLLGDRRKPVLLAATLSTFAGVLLLAASLLLELRGGWVPAGYCLLAVTNLGSPVSNALMKELNPANAVGTAVGVSNATCYLLTAAVTSMAGIVMDRFHAAAAILNGALIYPREAYLTILLCCAALLAISLIAAFFVRETYGRTAKNE